MKACYFLLFLWIQLAHTQNHFYGKLVDSITNKGIPLGHFFVQKGKGFYADKNGNFELTVDDPSLNVKITALGYRAKNTLWDAKTSYTNRYPIIDTPNNSRPMKTLNFNNKKFALLGNSTNGKVDTDTIFIYKQKGNLVTADYHGGSIKYGKIIALLNKDKLDMLYQCLTTDNPAKGG